MGVRPGGSTVLAELTAAGGPGPFVPLARVLALATEEQFLAAYAGTSLIRAKRHGLVRNAALAAAANPHRRLVPLLVRLANDPVLREEAVWALGRQKRGIKKRAHKV